MSRQDPYADFQSPAATDPYSDFSKPAHSWWDSAKEGVSSWLENANPIPVSLLKSIYERGNIETLKSIGATQSDQFVKAKASYDAGNYADAARYTIGGMIPFLGPGANAAGDELARGEYAKGIGHTAGLATTVAAPAAISRIRSIPVPPLLKSTLNPAEAEAVQFADRQNIPLDAATRTGNKVARGAQRLLQEAPGGAGVAADAREAQTAALTATGKNLQSQIEPRLGRQVYTPETASEAVVGSLRGQVQQFRTGATDAYSKLREIEARPENVVNISETPTAQAERSQQAFNQMVDQSVEARLEQIRADVRSGSTEMTGKTKREYVNPDDPFDVGPVTGRFAGGFKKSFSELASVEGQPGDIAKAIERGKGPLFNEVQLAVRNAVLEHEGDDIRTALRDAGLPPAEARNVNLPVDMRPVKAAVKPLYQELQQRWPIARQQSSQGLKSLENIMNGEDVLSASDADANLSALKGLQREAKDAQNLRLTSQAVDKLDLAVRAAVANAGPEATEALNRGRLLTRAKYETLDLLDTLKANDPKTYEPVRTFNMLTGDNDVRINLLRQVSKQSPQDLPKLGRAYMEGLLQKAEEEGGFGRTDRLFRDWQNLGPETKKLLFQNPQQIKDMDNFFLLAKRMAQNPYPSGTPLGIQLGALGGDVAASVGQLVLGHPEAAAAGLAAGGGYVLGARALSKVLFSPGGAKALANGFTLPIRTPRAALATSQILKLAGDEAIPIRATPALENAGDKSQENQPVAWSIYNLTGQSP